MSDEFTEFDEDLLAIAAEFNRPMSAAEFALHLGAQGRRPESDALLVIIEMRLLSGPLRHLFASIDDGRWLLRVDDGSQGPPFVPDVYEDMAPAMREAVNSRATPYPSVSRGLPLLLAKAILAEFTSGRATTVEGVLGIEPEGAPMPAHEALAELGVVMFGDIYDQFLHTLTYRSREIAELRVHAERPLTLEELGQHFSLTRERVRQLEKLITQAFDRLSRHGSVQLHAAVMRSVVAPVASDRVVRQRAAFLCVGSASDAAVMALMSLAGPYVLKDHWWVLQSESARLERLRADAVAEEDRLGRISELSVSRLTSGLFIDDIERGRYLTEVAGFVQIHGHWTSRDSIRRRVILALAHIGKPATKDEIASTAGLDEAARVSACLSSFDFVCRSDMSRWAFREWVSDPYNGIVAEIVQRIDEDGGATSVDRLMLEIPELFGAQSISVAAYLATPMFVVTAGLARLATQNELESLDFGNPADLPNAFKAADGNWGVRLPVEHRFLTGNSALIPVAVARHCGLLPGDSLLVPVEGTEFEASLIWRPYNTNRTVDCGRIREALAALDLRPGDEMVIIPRRTSVRILRADAKLSWGLDNQGSVAEEQQLETILEELL